MIKIELTEYQVKQLITALDDSNDPEKDELINAIVMQYQLALAMSAATESF